MCKPQPMTAKLDFILTEERTRIGGAALTAPPVFVCSKLSFPDCDFVSYFFLKRNGPAEDLPARESGWDEWLSSVFPGIRFELQNGFLNCRVESGFMADLLGSFLRKAETMQQNEAPVPEEDFFTEYAVNRLQVLLREFGPAPERHGAEEYLPAGEKADLALLLDRNQTLRTAVLLMLSASGMLNGGFFRNENAVEICFHSGVRKSQIRENAARLFYLYDSARQNAGEINFLFYRSMLAFLQNRRDA